MQRILMILSNEIAFWIAWVIIPLIMEIIPAIAGFVLLLKKRVLYHKDKALDYYPSVTVIVPVYNSADTLYACLDSIRKSDYSIEQVDVLLVNNGSRDQSFSVYTQFQKDYPQMDMKWMNSEQGKSRALNMALFHAQGKYIVHIDSDGILHPAALRNLVTRFESHGEIHCMTGTVLTNPEQIKDTKNVIRKIFQKTEFYEYAQAFLAGRNFEAEMNSIFTMSGAFSTFRKSTILKTQLYNTDTVCEDTHVTFQVRKLLKQRIAICENAVFFVDPIENLQKLCLQRQRWQRGELEVAHMFLNRGSVVKNFFTNFMTRVIMYDHTFAFPRMIWYFALICMTFVNYPVAYIVISLILIYFLYVCSAFLYYLNILSYLRFDKKLRHFYGKNILILLLLPFYNFIVYWFRMAGIINSIKTTGAWKTLTWKEEWEKCRQVMHHDLAWIFHTKHKYDPVNKDDRYEDKK